MRVELKRPPYLTDNDVANFARQSFNQNSSSFTDEQNHNLIRYLARGMPSKEWDQIIDALDDGVLDRDSIRNLLINIRNTPEHWAPFAHPHISLDVEVCVPIARQAFKHKQGFVESEVSRRYISSTPSIYVPDVFRAAAKNVKQGSAGAMPHSDEWRDKYIDHTNQGVRLYEAAINNGMCPEQARFILPQGTEVTWAWTGSLYAYANFYKQRIDVHAQEEIQYLAKEIGEIIRPLFPVSWDALTKGDY